MMYVQDLQHFPFKDLEDCLNHVEKIIKPVKYAGIVHDKDVDVENNLIAPHIHVMLQFENARSLDNIAKLLNDSPQYLEKWNGDSANGYSYLIHATSSAKGQYQYNIDEVRANFDFKALIENVKKGLKRAPSKDELVIRAYLDLLYTGQTTKEEIELRLSGSQYAKAKTRIENVNQKRLEHQAKEWREKMRAENREIDVIWIYGIAGVGKTRLAKDYAHSHSNRVFVSGSSRDPFQHYQLEEVIILDELRHDTFEYNDLLKMFDPFNDEVMGASRYHDKPLAASLIIVTSPYPPHTFFEKIINDNKKMDQTIDSFKQLARRIGLVINLTKEFMEVAFFQEVDNRFVLDKSTKELNPYYKENDRTITVMHERTEKLYKTVVDAIKNDKKPVNEPTKANVDKPSTAVQLSLELSHGTTQKKSDVDKNDQQNNL